MYQDGASSFVLRTRIFREAFQRNGTAAIHPRTMLERAFHTYAQRPLLGEPAASGSVQWWSFRDCGIVVRQIAQEMQRGIAQARPNAAAVICARNSMGWLLCDWACALAGIPSIVIDASTPMAHALSMADEAAQLHNRCVAAICAEPDQLIEWRAARPGLAEVSVIDARNKLIARGTSCDDVNVASAETAETTDSINVAHASDDLMTCLFSFGSSGAPKPLWFDSQRWAEWGERNPPASKRARIALARRSVRVSCAALFAPLSHGLARRTAWGELLHGGRLGLCNPRGDSGLELLEQIHRIEPTSLSAAPRFYSLYERRFEAERETAITAGMTKEEAYTRALTLVQSLGGRRLNLVAVGGAPVPPELLTFLRTCFGSGGAGGGHAVVSNGYGMTEVPGGIARDGVPLPGVEIKLLHHPSRSAPGDEWAGEAEEGVGEILVKTKRGSIVGTAGAAALDADGWFHTGDLGRWVEYETGERRLQVIERAGFAVKLANGEFFSPQLVEWAFQERCPSILNCVLFAHAGDAAPTAIVVPRRGDLEPADAMHEMRSAALEGRLRSWEIPGRVLIDPGPWDEANGCCSAHGKVRRLAIAQRNGLEAFMTTAGDTAACSRSTITPTESVGTIFEQIVAFLASATDADAAHSLPAAAASWEPGQDWWSMLGEDSVSAAELVSQLPSGSAVTVHDVFELSPWQLRRKAQTGCHKAVLRNGWGNEKDEACLLDAHRIASFWEQEVLPAPRVQHVPIPADGGRCQQTGPCLLLTGATGFLGPHLLHALLASGQWQTIVILVRPPLDRLWSHPVVRDAVDGDSREDKQQCQLRVFAANLSQASLGLSTSDHAELSAMKFDVVIHSGAAVDHARPYSALKPCNVDGSMALLDLVASAQRPPLFIFVSTMSVIPVAHAAIAGGWTGDDESLVPPACATALESGYAQSKLVVEHRLAAAAEKGDVRLVIARLGLMGSASRLPSGVRAEAVHVSELAKRRDWLSLMFCAIEATGASPAGLAAKQRSVAVLPVDIAAAELSKLASHSTVDALLPEVGEAVSPCTIRHLDAACFGIPPRPLSCLLDEIDARRRPSAPPLNREMPYSAWRRLVSAAGPPAVLALAMLPPEGQGGALRLPSGARRRLRERLQLSSDDAK